MKLCVLGNSHAGALRLAWGELAAEHPQHQLVFFAIPGTSYAKVTLREGSLLPGTQKLQELFRYTSGVADRIRPAEYDAFLVYGLGLTIPRRRRIDPRISSAVRWASYRDVLTTSLNFQMITLLRQVTSAPIFVGHNPIPSLLNDAEIPGEGELQSYEQAVKLIAHHWSADQLHLVAQPQATFLKDWVTDPRFTVGSQKLDVGRGEVPETHDDQDVSHMNAAYGRLWLEDFFRCLSALDFPAPRPSLPLGGLAS